MVAIYTNAVASNWYDVTDYGVLTSNTGATNVTNLGTLLTAATNGSTIYFPGGIYPMTGNVAVPTKSYNFVGQGSTYSGQNSVLQWSANVSGSLFTLPAGSYWGTQFLNLTFSSAAAQSAGYAVEANGNNSITFRSCCFQGGSSSNTLAGCIDFIASSPGGSVTCIVDSCQMANFTGTAINCNSNSSSVVITSTTVNGILTASTNTVAAAGIAIAVGGAIQIDNCDIIGCTNNLLINPTSSNVVASVWATNTYFDNAFGSCVKITGAGATVRSKFTGCSFTTTGTGFGSLGGTLTALSAFEMSSTYAYGANGQGLDIIDCNVLNTGATSGTTNGFLISGSGDVRISECNIAAWTNGIQVTPATVAGTTRLMVLNNVIGPCGNYAGNTTGVLLNAGSATYGNIVVKNNNLSGNTTNVTDNSTIPASPTQIMKTFTDNAGMSSAVAITATTAGTAAAKIIASMPVPAGGLRAGSVFQFEGYMTTTAADSAAVTVYFGTGGTTSDTSIGTATSLASAVTGDCYIRGTVTMRSATSAATVISTLSNAASGAQTGNTTVTATTIANTSNSYLSVGINAATTATIQSMVIWPVIQ